VADAEREAILAALRAARGNKSRAAQALGITRKALYRRMGR
jgi:transcriptional regulator of acetoin/glycerol metabolism